jgi:GTPase SAR1 family protein
MIQMLYYQFKYGTLVNFFLILAGAERYRAITTSHIRNADGAFLVFDITSENSFDTLDFWYDLIKKATGDDIVIHLIGNKCDLTSRAVSRERARQFASKYNLISYSETSAKEDINIKETFISFYKSKF